MLFSLTTKAQNGEALFRRYCGICHTIGGGRLVGPDLNGVTSKRSEEWLMKMTKGSQDLINSGDTAAKAVFQKFNIIMPNQTMPDSELKEILAFITVKSKSVSAENTGASGRPNGFTSEKIILGWNNPLSWLFLLVLIVVFFSVHIIINANMLLKEEGLQTNNFILNLNLSGLIKKRPAYQTHLVIQLFVLVLLTIIWVLTTR